MQGTMDMPVFIDGNKYVELFKRNYVGLESFKRGVNAETLQREEESRLETAVKEKMNLTMISEHLGLDESRLRELLEKQKNKVPIWEKANLTLEEMALYSGIGVHKLRSLTDSPDCKFVLWIGNKRLIKRKQFDEYIDKQYSI